MVKYLKQKLPSLRGKQVLNSQELMAQSQKMQMKDVGPLGLQVPNPMGPDLNEDPNIIHQSPIVEVQILIKGGPEISETWDVTLTQ